MKPLFAAAVAACLAALAATGATSALTDEKPAVLTCSVDNSQPAIGSQLAVECGLVDSLGLPAMDADLTFYLNFEARTDAFWDDGRKTAIKSTNSQGKATAWLDTGKTAGSLGILVNYPGIFSSFTVVQVVAPPPLLPAPPELPDEIATEFD